MESETAMVREAQAGSESAWRRLFELHFDAVYRFCLALAAGRRELAEETAQQCFVAAAQRISRFDPKQGTFRAWLLGIARNRYMTLRAGDRRRRFYESLPRESNCGSADRCEPDLRVHETLALLPLEYRRALEDKYLHQQTLKERAHAIIDRLNLAEAANVKPILVQPVPETTFWGKRPALRSPGDDSLSRRLLHFVRSSDDPEEGGRRCEPKALSGAG